MRQLSIMTDEELAVVYAEGNNKAFDILLERHKTKLFTYINFMVRNQEVANDVFQDTFVKVIVRLQNGDYQPSGKFGAWLTRIAHNIIMDRFRNANYENVVDVTEENDIDRLGHDAIESTFAEAQFINEQVFSDVKHLMDRLPALQREVVFMRFFQDLSFKEIAETTGVSINTSLGRMRYAVLNLRKMAKQNNMQLQLM